MVRSLVDRMADKFTVGDGCWEWTAATNRKGYGVIGSGGRKGRQLVAHRVVYELLVGPIPTDLQLDHLCRNRRCVRPAHLEPVTNRENSLRGAGHGGVLWDGHHHNTAKLHCPQGHPYDEANTRHTGSGRRECRACCREKYRRYRTKKRKAA